MPRDPAESPKPDSEQTPDEEREGAEHVVPLTPVGEKIGEGRDNLRRREAWFKRRTTEKPPGR